MSACVAGRWAVGVGRVPALFFLLGILSVFFFMASSAAPERADAYIGQGLVETATGGLTTGAEELIKEGEPVAETVIEAGEKGGSEAASNAEEVFAAGGDLPTVGVAVGSFTAGWEVGTEICNSFGISGCFHLFGDSANKLENRGGKLASGAGSWTFEVQGFIPGQNAVWVWFPAEDSNQWYNAYAGQSGTPPGCENVWIPDPPRPSLYVQSSEVITWDCTSPTGVHENATKQAAIRYAMEGLHLSWSPTDNASVPDMSTSTWSPSSEFSKKTATALRSSAAGEEVGQHLAHELSSSVADPYAVNSPLPASCHVGGSGPACIAALKELEVVPEVTELDWEDAVVEELEELDPEKAREEDAERIIELPDPLPAEVTRGSDFPITVNPPEEEMPEFIPEPEEGETEEEYEERKVPWIPLPFWHAEELDDATLDPSKGPEEITEMNPAPGTRVNPDGETDEHVKYNPSDAPVPSSSAWSPPSVPAISLAPLTGAHISCNSFPFGIFCWYGSALTSWGSEGRCPAFSLPVGHGTHVDDSGELGINSCEWEPAMNVVRPVIVLLGTLGIGMFFAYAALGLGGSGGDD